ncbi:MAG: PEGA domain-containing protein [Deltaproteobacteria bacterium]|nr:PEGA domain-containing protein [Deltaproteobacteria bacterium]MBN2672859.1 PEGA domain-containing protein [Deltaproteobacteria bacterium]
MGALNSRMRSGFVILGTVLTLGIWSFPVVADDAASAPDSASAVDADDSVALARDNFAAGQAAYEVGDFEKADVHFSKAYELKPHPSALKMVAECKLQLGRLPEAAKIMEQLLEDSSYDKKKQLKRRLKKVKKKLGKLSIETSPEGAVVSLNGKILDEKTPTSVYVYPGPQVVVLLMDSYEEQQRQVDVAAQKEETVSVDYSTLTPIPVPAAKPELIDDPFEEEAAEEMPAEDPAADAATESESEETADSVAAIKKESEPPKAFWAAAAIAGVGLVSGTVFGTMALRDEKDFEDTGDSATKDSGRRSAVIADISFGVAIGAAVAGAIILIHHKNKKKAAAENEQARFYVQPEVGTQCMGLSSGFSF